MRDFGALSYKWNILINVPSPEAQASVKDEAQRLLEPEVMNDNKEPVLPNMTVLIHI